MGLTQPSCACGRTSSRGSSRSSSWPGPGRAGRRPESPLSGQAFRTERALWSSSRSTRHRNRCCWLYVGWVEGGRYHNQISSSMISHQYTIKYSLLNLTKIGFVRFFKDILHIMVQCIQPLSQLKNFNQCVRS